MLESIVSGIIQGVFEWLPISSEGVLVLAKVNLFGSDLALTDLISYALFLHLGTFLAVLIYFRKEVIRLIKELLKYKSTDDKTKKLLNFYIIATLFTAIIALIILGLLKLIEGEFAPGGKVITLLIGLLLIITAVLQFREKEEKYKKTIDLKPADGVLLGLVQGLAVLPGLSRSGLTISTLLLRKFNSGLSLRLSFLMSLPVVLGGNIILNLDKFSLGWQSLVGLVFSFLFGMLTIYTLLKVSHKINFGWFALIFAVLTILAVFI